MGNLSWAEEALGRLRASENEVSITISEDRLCRSQSPVEWAKVRDHMKRNCVELNKKAGFKILNFDVTVIDKARVRLLNRRGKVVSTLTVDLDLDARRLRYGCGHEKGEFILDPNVANSSVHILDEEGNVITTKEAAGRLLNLLF